MIIHFHYSPNPNSGEIRRIRNINNEICNIAKTKCIEVEFYSLRDRKQVKKTWRFNLTDNVVRKYYVPLVPFTGNSSFIQWICDLWTSIVILFIYLRHRRIFDKLFGYENERFIELQVYYRYAWSSS